MIRVIVSRLACPLLVLACAVAPLSAAEDAAGSGGFWPWMLFGRLHVVTVHFPIALLTVVLIIEGLRLIRRTTAPDATLTVITVIASLSAVTATVMGWAQASTMSFAGNEASLLFVHRWLGVATATLSVIVTALALALQLLNRPGLRKAYLAALGITVVGVSAAGHYGGMLVHGEDYFPSVLPAWLHPADKKAQSAEEGPVVLGDPVDFTKDIEPMFKKVCYECHNAEKQKGDLRMDSREALLKGGANGPSVVPGHPMKSLIIQRVLGLGDDPRMPKKKDPLTDQQIDLLKRWVAQGAVWSTSPPSSKPGG
jgi:uncharacterized membrane protein